MSRHASGRGGAAREPTWQASQGQACAVVLGSGGAGPPGLSAVASGARAGEAVAIGGGGGAGGRGGLLQARLSRRRPVAGREGKVWAVAFRPGHGSGASESVHRGLRELVAVSNLSEAVQDADLLVFVIPHQFIHRICDEITGRVPKKALGITLIKGIDEGPEGLKLISDIIREKMGIDISVLMGANIASEVAADKFCETTIGSKVMENGLLFKELLQTPNFRITVVDDADTVELCGALKNIVAVGAGFCDGLCCGDNTKAAVIRLGLMEMISFAKIFCKGQVSTATFLESCGVADLITTCYGGRNRRVAEAFARTGKTIEELEKEMLNGQKLQGPQTSAEVYRILKQKALTDKFPLFTAVYQICYEGRPVSEMLSCLQSHPEHT
ncbi:glycerol-3-phosphate dehydrogenase 1-like protein isoform X1 [Cavia porcellus]|uniref:glycerol-3-phosphate dehydrogenase 1-like protein isoform X1 n=1 Tax=Cavia porcellus TaxID=10141 RepID=UPI002FDFF170